MIYTHALYNSEDGLIDELHPSRSLFGFPFPEILIFQTRSWKLGRFRTNLKLITLRLYDLFLCVLI